MDRNYPGPCVECCGDICYIVTSSRQDITVTFSGITTCSCVHMASPGTFWYTISAAVNSTFTLTAATNYLLLNAVTATVSVYSDAMCTILVHTGTVQLGLGLNCVSGGANINLSGNYTDGIYSLGNIIFFFGVVSDPLTSPANNTNGACGTGLVSTVFGTGGTVSLSW